MKKNDLIKIIELVVRKEVKKQMTEIFINDKEEIKLSEVISKPKVVKKKTSFSKWDIISLLPVRNAIGIPLATAFE